MMTTIREYRRLEGKIRKLEDDRDTTYELFYQARQKKELFEDVLRRIDEDIKDLKIKIDDADDYEVPVDN